MAILEALAEFAEVHDLARLSWRVDDEPPTPVAERRRPRVVFEGIAVDVPADGFLQASAEADAVFTELVLLGVGSAKRVPGIYPGVCSVAVSVAQHATVHAVDRGLS